MKFRKKPVVIDAIQFTRTLQPADLFAFLGSLEKAQVFPKEHCLVIRTLEGEMLADEGDWIIRGVKGEFYPVKPEIFAATYEPVESER